MYTLSQVLAFAGYATLEEQLAYVKLLAYKGAFEKFSIADTSCSTHFIKQQARAAEATRIWQRLNLFKVGYVDKIVDDPIALTLLKAKFSSLQTGFAWLVAVTQFHFLRPTFDDEAWGVEPKLITSQWHVQDEMDWRDLNAEDEAFKLYECFKNLHLMNAMPWPDLPVQHIVLISSLESYIKDRLLFMPNIKGKLYVVGGPRGLFNNESTLAEILAEWFEEPDKKDLIQSVLDKHQNDTLNWTQHLSALKGEICNVLGHRSWCDAEAKSWYYKEPHRYEQASIKNGSESLKDWPVTMDMVSHLIKKETSLTEIELVSVLSMGSDHHLPTTKDFVHSWYQQYGRTVLMEGHTPLFLICNAAHRLTLLQKTLLHAMDFQEGLRYQSITNDLTDYHQQQLHKAKLGHPPSIWIAGPTNNIFSPTRAFDVLARSLWPLETHIFEEKAAFKATVEHKNNLPIALVADINRYHDYKRLMHLAHASIQLAIYFYLFEDDYIKATGLLSFAKDVLKNPSHKMRVENLLQKLKICNAINFQQNLNRATTLVKRTADTIDPTTFTQLIKNYRHTLRDIRMEIKQQLDAIIHPHRDNVLNMYTECSLKMRNFFIELLHISQHFLKKNTYVEFILFGSTARLETTSFSDIEFAMLIENDKALTLLYAKELTKIILLLILNLGETNLRSLGISFQTEDGKTVGFTKRSLDEHTLCRGFAFDSNDPFNACKTPFGAKTKNGKVIYRLIGSLLTLAKLACEKGFKKDSKLPALFRLSKPLGAQTKLFDEFKQQLLQEPYELFNYIMYLIKKDFKKNIDLLNEIEYKEVICHKDYLYRGIQVLLDYLFLFLNERENCNSYQKIDKLFAASLIDKDDQTQLHDIITFILYIKMQQHFYHQQNKIFIPTTDAQGIVLVECLQRLKKLFEKIALKVESPLFYERASQLCLFKPASHNTMTEKNDLNPMCVIKSV